MMTCASCGAWFVWPRPTIASATSHYSGNDAGLPAHLRQWRTGTRQYKSYERMARRMRRYLNRQGREARCIVDVGAGGLELTAALAHQFTQARIEAWDLFADGFERPIPSDVTSRISMRRLDLNALDSASLPPQTFDLVACVAVIEHVVDPIQLLRNIKAITAPDGVAYIAGPDVTSPARRLLGRRWPYYCPDEHVTLPTLHSIERAIGIAGGGPYRLRRMTVAYSLKYLMRYLGLPAPWPAAIDPVVPMPTGAFELIWECGIKTHGR